jgi:Uncharacterized conserved protein
MAEAIYIHPAEARRQFKELAAGEINGENLARGALLVALEEYPRIDVEQYLYQLNEITSRVLARCTPSDPGIFRLGHLHAVMFDADRFRGNSESYYDVRNSFLNEVLDRKIGIPITLSIIFMHVARKIGLSATGVGLPGHYVVKVQFELNEVYVDPFHQGSTLTMNDISQLVQSLTPGGARATTGHHLRSWSERETLMRVLANLQNLYTRMGDQRRAQSARERIEMLMDLA